MPISPSSLCTLAVATLSFVSPAMASPTVASLEADLLDRAEQASREGQLPRAEALFAQLEELAPRNAIPSRRRCEVLRQLGRRNDAIRACERAVQRAGGSAREMGALVSALVSGPGQPTAQNLLHASLYADAAVTQARLEPWGYAARCEVARLWGEPAMMSRCLDDLVRLFPDHEETRRALALSSPGTPLQLLGWTILGLGVLGTLAHAALRGLRKRRGRVLAPGLALLALAGAVVTVPAQAQAQQARQGAPITTGFSKHPINHADPEASVPSPDQRDRDPMEYGYFLQDVLTAAEGAEQRRDHKAAARYYRAIVKAVPDRAKGFTKLCQALQADGQTAEALKACELALTKEGVIADDFIRYARMLLARSGELTPAEVDDVKGVVAHLRGQPGARVFGHHIECELATRRDDVALLESCTAGLVKDAPQDAKTISFQWALALKKRDHQQALALIVRARQAGVGAEGITRMESATTSIRPFWQAMFLDLRYLGLGAVALGALGLLVASRRRRAALPS